MIGFERPQDASVPHCQSQMVGSKPTQHVSVPNYRVTEETVSETEVINAAWMISAPIVHVGIDEIFVSPRKLALCSVCGHA